VKIAIVGSGISGLLTAHLLADRHAVTVFEADDRVGGHTHTVPVEVGDRSYRIDTGFIVYNERTYPGFCRMLDRLGVETQPSDMSFSVACDRTGLEWGSRGLGGVFAQRRNWVRPSFHRMVRDVMRFNREARDVLESADEKLELGEYLCGAGYTREFVDHYVVPMGAAIWSARPADFLRFPAAAFIRFFDNHGLLVRKGHFPWRVVKGGSDGYVAPLCAPFADRIRTRCPVHAVRRDADGVELRFGDGGCERFDRVVLAVHSDQARGMLVDATDAEHAILSSVEYQRNDVVLHTDASVMPRAKRAWASWNYRVPVHDQESVFVSYHMNRLQGLDSEVDFFVTLNGDRAIDPGKVLDTFVYHHPVFDTRALRAQRLHAEIDGRNHTHFCGAWWGWGFHEDGVQSALTVCEKLGARL
jgi:predicted NAD/FAD-binding protein